MSSIAAKTKRYSANAPDLQAPAMRFSSVEFKIGAVRTADLPVDGLPEIALVGRSNVGKSSLINRLVQRKKLARISTVPGKTQQLNYYLANGQFYLVDLPGYGYVRGGVGLRLQLGQLIRSYMANREPLCAVLQLVDARRGPTDLDQQMIDHLRTLDKPFLLVFTKADKLSRNKLQHLFDQLDAQGSLAGLSFVPFSAVDGRGQDDITGWISEALVGNAT